MIPIPVSVFIAMIPIPVSIFIAMIPIPVSVFIAELTAWIRCICYGKRRF